MWLGRKPAKTSALKPADQEIHGIAGNRENYRHPQTDMTGQRNFFKPWRLKKANSLKQFGRTEEKHPWPTGKATDSKSVNVGSNPTGCANSYGKEAS